MKTFTTTLMCACLALSAASALAADDTMTKTPSTMTPPVTNKSSTMSQDEMAKPGTMTMQQCKDQMAMEKKNPTMKKDDATMKMDATCADMMKKGTGTTQKDPGMMKN